MINQILNLFNTALNACISWFTAIFTSTGLSSLYLSMIMVTLTVGIILSPLLGSIRTGASDKASKKRSSSADSE